MVRKHGQSDVRLRCLHATAACLHATAAIVSMAVCYDDSNHDVKRSYVKTRRAHRTQKAPAQNAEGSPTTVLTSEHELLLNAAPDPRRGQNVEGNR